MVTPDPSSAHQIAWFNSDRALRTLHEEPRRVVGGEARRAPHRLQPPLAEPFGYAIQHRRGHARVVDALEPSEEPDRLFVKGLVVPVPDRADAPHRTLSSKGQKGLSFGVLVEWVLRSVERPANVPLERRHPVGVTPIDRPRQLDELLELSPALDGDHTDGDVGSVAHGRSGAVSDLGEPGRCDLMVRTRGRSSDDVELLGQPLHLLQHEIELIIRVGRHVARAQTATALRNGRWYDGIGEHPGIE